MKTLLLVDIQNGFCPGGNLPVAGGDEIIPVVNALIASGRYDLVVASLDWHPADHGSFASQHPGKKPFEMGDLGGVPQMLWPDHCVQGTKDADFHPLLNTAAIDHVQHKGVDPLVDSYSAFKDNAGDASTGLDEYLRDCGVTEIDVCGLATDYCVRFTAEDAVAFLPGVKVRIIIDACRGITQEGVDEAIAAVKAKGVAVVSSKTFHICNSEVETVETVMDEIEALFPYLVTLLSGPWRQPNGSAEEFPWIANFKNQTMGNQYVHSGSSGVSRVDALKAGLAYLRANPPIDHRG